MDVSNKSTPPATPIADQEIKPLKKGTKARKAKKSITTGLYLPQKQKFFFLYTHIIFFSVNESFILPLSPESDASNTPIPDTKTNNLRKESKDENKEDKSKVQKVDKQGK